MKPSPKVFETDKYKIAIHSTDFVELLIKENVMLDVALLIEIKKTIEDYKPQTKFYIFAEGVGFFNVEKGVRELSAKKKFTSHVVASAFFTKNPSLLLIGELYHKINKPAVATKMFIDREKARRWIKSLMEKDKLAVVLSDE